MKYAAKALFLPRVAAAVASDSRYSRTLCGKSRPSAEPKHLRALRPPSAMLAATTPPARIIRKTSSAESRAKTRSAKRPSQAPPVELSITISTRRLRARPSGSSMPLLRVLGATG